MRITEETTREEVLEKTTNTLYKMIEKKNEKDDPEDARNTIGEFVRKSIIHADKPRTTFHDYDFMRLFIAMLTLNQQVTLDVDNLGYKLYKYHDSEEYRVLLQDFAVKQQIEGNFYRVENAVQTAILSTLLSCSYPSPIHPERAILIGEDEAKEILSSYHSEIVEKMESLTKDFISSYTKPKQKLKDQNNG